MQTLLKTGSESSVDRLMKQIATFMSEITDEFKVVVVKAIHELCLRYPAKYRVLLMFLSTRSAWCCTLRDKNRPKHEMPCGLPLLACLCGIARAACRGPLLM